MSRKDRWRDREVGIDCVFGGGEVSIAVTDTGTGIAADELARIFQVYYSTKKGGTGLGLPTTRRIIREHGGTIQVHSEPGKGTSVKVLPEIIALNTGNQVLLCVTSAHMVPTRRFT